MKSIKNDIQSALNNLDRKGFLFPVVLLLICFFAYGVLVSKLGFYFDDWPVILMIKEHLNIWEFFKLTRPFSAWTYALSAPLLGLNPINWHIFIFILRWLTGLGAYWTLIQLWPGKKREIVLMVCLFVVYPAFWQQSISVAYSQHFVAYLLFFISIGSMLAALGRKNNALLWSISFLTAGVHLMTMEYFWGLELLRPVFIGIFLAQTSPDIKKRINQTVKTWLPFLVIFMGVFIWRFFIINLPEDPNPLAISGLFSSNAINNWLDLSQNIIRDLSSILVTGWYPTFQTDMVDRRVPYLVFAWFLVAGSSGLAYLYFHIRDSGQEQGKNSSWTKQALLLGFLIILFGTIPGWAVNRFVTEGRYADRIALPALFGASIVLVSIISFFISSYKKQIFLVSVLIGLGVGAQFRVGNDYRWEWVDQQRVFWQLYWRAPMVKENTVFITDGGFFKYTGDYPASMELNVLYAQNNNSFEQPYWILELDDYFKNEGGLLPGTKVGFNNLNLSFTGVGENSVVLDYVKDGSCLKIYTELDVNNLVMPELFRRATHLFNSSRIIPESTIVPDPKVFGVEPPHTWCYYFEKAELAKQQDKWQTIVDLGNELMKKGYGANRPVEWFPFIEGYVHTGNMDQAEQINSWVIGKDEQVLPQLCGVWEDLAGYYPEQTEKALKITQIWRSLSCPQVP